MAAIFELDENLSRSYTMFEAAPIVSISAPCTMERYVTCHHFYVCLLSGGEGRTNKETSTRVFLMRGLSLIIPHHNIYNNTLCKYCTAPLCVCVCVCLCVHILKTFLPCYIHCTSHHVSNVGRCSVRTERERRSKVDRCEQLGIGNGC